MLSAATVWAQTSDLTPEEEQAVKQQAKVKVETFTQYVSFVASKEYEDDVRATYAKAALDLFLGKGKEWKDAFGNVKPAPQMQVSSLNPKTKQVTVQEYAVSLYMHNLQYLNYTNVRVESSKASFISSIKKTGTNEYETTLTYVQIFIGERDGVIVYQDKTTKTVKVILKRVGDEQYHRWDVLLGDISVSATEPTY
jgi:hypothetical protein